MSLDSDWCHKFDFTKSQEGFTFTWPSPGRNGISIWVDGQGFKTASNAIGGQRLYISRSFLDTTIVGAKMVYRGTGTAPAQTVYLSIWSNGVSNSTTMKRQF